MTLNETTGIQASTDHLSTKHGRCDRVLEPFVHQVSGRAHMLSLNPTTLCKSLSIREWNFYNKLPASLRSFTPNVKGLLFVQLERDGANTHRFMTSNTWVPSEENSSFVESQLNNNNNNECACKILDEKPPVSTDENDIYWHRTFEQTLFKGLERVKYTTNNGFTSHAWTVDKDQEAVTESLGRNPWSLRQHKREINRTLKGDILRKEIDLQELCREIGMQESLNGKASVDHCTKAYLLLEDVTVKYQYPSILDLKIGTQLDRPGCSQAKRDKHYNLVQKSSTGSLGLRLAGMQVYQVSTGQYLCRDKYYGRGLSSKGFIDALRQFLHNGSGMLTEVIQPIIDRLVALRAELEKQDSFRFHASSVLISYEGGVEVTCLPRAQESLGCADSLPTAMHEKEGMRTKIALNTNNNCNAVGTQVGVHMIDFAHSTFKGFLEDKTTYEGPDKDCLHALDNLVSVLRDIMKNEMST